MKELGNQDAKARVKYLITSNDDLYLHFSNNEYYTDRLAVERYENLSGLFGDLCLYKQEGGLYYLYNGQRGTFLQVDPRARRKKWHS